MCFQWQCKSQSLSLAIPLSWHQQVGLSILLNAKKKKKKENIDRAVLAHCWLGKAFLRDYPGRQVSFLQTKAVQQIPV